MKKTSIKSKPAAMMADATPTWQAVLPILLEGHAMGRDSARLELERMAQLAQAYTIGTRVSLIRADGAEGQAFLESTERGRRVMDAVQHLLSPTGAGGYGLDLPGFNALASVFRALSHGCFVGVVQDVPSQRRVRAEVSMTSAVRFVIRHRDTDQFLSGAGDDDESDVEWCGGVMNAMKIPLGAIQGIADSLERNGDSVEIIMVR